MIYNSLLLRVQYVFPKIDYRTKFAFRHTNSQLRGVMVRTLLDAEFLYLLECKMACVPCKPSMNVVYKKLNSYHVY